MLNIFDQITYFQIEIMEKHLGNDLKERRLKFQLLNVHEFYSELDELDRVALKKSITNINPSLMCISICYSDRLDLRFVLELEAIFPDLRLKRDLTMVTKGKQINLDATQRELLFTLSDPVNVEKSIIIHGPEGSGKSILAAEATKIKFSHYLNKYKLKGTEGKGKVRILICGAYRGDDRVPVLLQCLQEELKDFQDFCTLQTQAIGEFKVDSLAQFNKRMENVLTNVIDGKHIHTIILLDELLPDFNLGEWTGIWSKNIDFVIALKHSHSLRARGHEDSFTGGIELSEELQRVGGVSVVNDTVLCLLKKRFRCSNEITALIYYLLIHSDKHWQLKSFQHSLDSFDSGKKPTWIQLENVEHFIDFCTEDDHFKKLKCGVMVIYDPSDHPFTLQPLKKFCNERHWMCYSSSDIVGSEAETVIIFDLPEFHFEAFSRAINDLVIVTTKRKVPLALRMKGRRLNLASISRRTK